MCNRPASGAATARGAFAFFALGLLLLAPRTAWSHSTPRSYCMVHTVPEGLEVTVETASHLLSPALGLSSRLPDDTELRAALPRLTQQLEDRVQASTPEGACSVTPGAFELGRRDGERNAALTLLFRCPPGEVTLRNTWRLGVDPTSESVCAIDGAAWVFRVGYEERSVGTPPRMAQVLGAFVRLGAEHVASGTDHLLFLLALLLAAACPAREHGLGRTLRGAALVVTGFTLGHSITLVAAGLGWARLEPRLTESAIALSIVLVAVENVTRDDIRGRPLVAAVFGLVHGFGFASVLAGTELPPRGTVWALLAFNLGVELAQLAAVLALLPALAGLARRPWYRRRVLVPASAVIAAFGALWLLKRAAGLDIAPWLGS